MSFTWHARCIGTAAPFCWTPFTATLALRTGAEVGDVRNAIELVCDKIGMVLIVLGGMHFFNIYVFNRLRRRGQADSRIPIASEV